MANRLLTILACASATFGNTLAASPLDDAVSLSVLSGWSLPDGQRMAAIRLDLAPGWKTYWRAPGDAGIPPTFNWRGKRNADAISVLWPTPQVYFDYGMRSIGYEGQVTLPLRIATAHPGKPIRLRGEMNIGVCSDVCVPHTLDIDALLPADPTAKPTPAIVAALAQMPYSAEEANVQSAVCSIAPMEDGMRIEANIIIPTTGAQEVTVIEPGIPGVWTSEPKTTRSGQTLTAVSEMMHMNQSVFSVDRSAVRITVLGSNYAVDIQGCTGG